MVIKRTVKMINAWVKQARGSRKVFALVQVASLLIVAAPMLQAPIVAAQDKNVVTIFADGRTRLFATDAGTVKQALGQAGVRLSDSDLVEPALDEVISGGNFHINVYRARPVLVIDGDKRYQVMSPRRRPYRIS